MAEVGGPLVGVEVGRDLELSRQRVEDAHPRFGAMHRLVVDDVVLARLAVVVLGLEPLLLNPEKVNDCYYLFNIKRRQKNMVSKRFEPEKEIDYR